MRRIFAEHRLRNTRSLDGLWALHPDDASGAVYSAYVPGVWEQIPALSSFRGTADYERDVEIYEDGNYLLRMGAVSHTGNVYWDGVHAGAHYNAFTGFDVLLRNVSAGAHRLRVNVDNRFGEESTLHIPNDYYTYGGINRSVELQKVGSAYIDRMAFHSVKIGENAYRAVVRVYVHCIDAVGDAEISIAVAGIGASACIGAMKPDERRSAELSLDVENVREWDVLNPFLYDLTAVLSLDGHPADDMIDRVGFRTVELAGSDILINGKKIKIKGFNRHEDHGLFGCALPENAMMNDLQLILETGANSIRTCHYPNDPKFLDLCDELGILVWEEHHNRAIPMEIMRKPLFAEQERQCNEEMVFQHVNHPCIYIWGVLNECESATEEGRAIFAEQIGQIRRLDPTRPVSFATCRTFSDICLDLADVVSWNIYPGWYFNESAEDYTAGLIAWSDEHGAKGKPMLITEIGAGGIAGFRDPLGKAKWSEERQGDILNEQLTAVLSDPRLCGVYVWQFADVRVAEEWAMGRPNTRNNKGVVSTLRSPKLSFETVRKIFSMY